MMVFGAVDQFKRAGRAGHHRVLRPQRVHRGVPEAGSSKTGLADVEIIPPEEVTRYVGGS